MTNENKLEEWWLDPKTMNWYMVIVNKFHKSIRIFTRALSEKEIKEHYQKTKDYYEK